MKKILTISSLLLLTVAAVVSFLHIEKWIHVDLAVVKICWWVFTASIVGYAFFKKSLTTWILVAMVIGVQVGFNFRAVALDLQVLSKVFLKLIKTVIGPILFATLVVGIAGHSNLKQLGRMGWKSLLYFEVVTTLALGIGLVAINVSQAGRDIKIPAGLIHDLPKSSEKQMQEKMIALLDSAQVSVPEGLINRLPDAPGK